MARACLAELIMTMIIYIVDLTMNGVRFMTPTMHRTIYLFIYAAAAYRPRRRRRMRKRRLAVYNIQTHRHRRRPIIPPTRLRV